jgi:hypothetical protein
MEPFRAAGRSSSAKVNAEESDEVFSYLVARVNDKVHVILDT